MGAADSADKRLASRYPVPEAEDGLLSGTGLKHITLLLSSWVSFTDVRTRKFLR